MDVLQSLKPSASVSSLGTFHKLLEAATKRPVIKLRWPLVILCAYLLLYAPNSWLTPAQTNAVLIFYLLSNVTLYLVADDFFDSPYFYGPLLFFDTVFLAIALVVSGGATPDFYVACFFTFVLSCVCNDSRGLLVVTLLAPVLYAYVVHNATMTHDASVYLRLLFPLAIGIFRGYFAQIERIKQRVKEQEDQAKQRQKPAEELRRQRDRLEFLHEVSVAVTSAVDAGKMLDVFLEKALIHLPYAAAMVRLLDYKTGLLETVASKGIAATGFETSINPLGLVDEILEARSSFTSGNVFIDPRIKNLELFRQEGLVSFVGLPLVANGEFLGNLVLLKRQEHDFCEEEIGFLSTLAGQIAIAIHHSQLFGQIQQQADELRQANKVKDEFLGVVSHELKTPLNVISGYSSMLSEGRLGEITPIQEKALQTVSRQSKELHNLIDSVLQVNSMDAEMLQTEFQQVNFWELLCELRAFYDYPLEENMKLIWAFQADLPILYSDRRKLRHILENLINNAIRFTKHGSVTISSRYLPSKKVMEFKVTDTGIGIPKELLPTIFERFRQLDNAENRVHGGVGLGLYIVKQYTDLLGGTIHVESKLGQGSTFTLRVPSRPTSSSSEHEQLSFPIARQSSGSNAA
ncbi:MAG TPA: GAF domain-containing sensor histidine kinase [Candidatus Binatia bacterium]|nr:GAF domain-containing sensor histidine kinase [Candidatus Binatia bacterium]